MRILYTILYLHLLPFVILRLYWRSIKSPGYRRRIKERFAGIPKRKSISPLIWIHAVSVGETVAATPLIKQLMHEHPDWDFCITTTTPTGSDQVLKTFKGNVLHYYLPYDLPSLFNRFLTLLKPQMLVIMETELWPNMVATCHEHDVPIILANGRMSVRSMRGYQRLSSLTRAMLQQLTYVAAQSESDAKRFLTLGVNSDRIVNTGSIKYDVSLQEETHKRTADLSRQLQLQDRKVIIFASTHPKEDEMFLPLLKELCEENQNVLGLVVPRHLERFNKVYELCQKQQMGCVKVSENKPITNETAVVLGDTMGDLMAYYGLSSIAFVGGSLIHHGGHNYLEAAIWALPIVTGPSVYNFQAVADRLVKAGGMVIVNDEKELKNQLQQWLDSPIDADRAGQAALHVLKANQGALAHLVSLIHEAMPVKS